MDTSFNLAPQQEINRVLDSSESLIWSGIPRQGLLPRANDALMIPLA